MDQIDPFMDTYFAGTCSGELRLAVVHIRGCTSLRSIEVHPDNQYLSSKDGVLFNKEGNVLIWCPESYPRDSYNVPDTVREIGWYAFHNCASLKTIDIPESVIKIESDAFSGCTSLRSITIPESVKEIGASAFEDCISLKTVKVPASIRIIEHQAFHNCPSLKSIRIPKTVWIRASFGKGVNIRYFKSKRSKHPKKSNQIQKTLD